MTENSKNINEKDEQGQTKLHLAALNGHIGTVEALINAKADINAKDKEGNTALHLAALNGHTGTVEKLIKELEADINAKNEQDQTALHAAALYGHTETVKELKELGANINAKDKEGYTALYLAALNGHTGTVEKLIKELEADINEKDKRGNTALHAAAVNGHTGTVEKLIKELEADINAKNEQGNTALHGAALNGRTETVKALKKLGADIDEKDKQDQTALHLAAQNGRTETVKELIKLGANINEKDKRGNTALHEATLYGRTETVKALIEAGADINAKNEQDNTAFCLAASIGNIPIVGLLLPDDPSKHINSKGYTPLHFLSTLYQSKKDELIETLKEVENREKYLNLLKGIEDRIADCNTAEIERKIAEDSHYKGDIVTPEYLMKKDTDTEYLQDLQEDLQDILFGGITSTLPGKVGQVKCTYGNNRSSVKIVITPEADSIGTTLNQLEGKLKELGFKVNSDNNLEATVDIKSKSMKNFINTHKYLQDLKDDLQEVLFGGITKTLLKEAEVGKVECNYENDELSSVKIVITPEADSSFKSMVRGTTSNQLKDKLKKLGFEANSDNKLEATVDINSMRDFINTYKTCCHLL